MIDLDIFERVHDFSDIEHFSYSHKHPENICWLGRSGVLDGEDVLSNSEAYKKEYILAHYDNPCFGCYKPHGIMVKDGFYSYVDKDEKGNNRFLCSECLLEFRYRYFPTSDIRKNLHIRTNIIDSLRSHTIWTMQREKEDIIENTYSKRPPLQELLEERRVALLGSKIASRMQIIHSEYVISCNVRNDIRDQKIQHSDRLLKDIEPCWEAYYYRIPFASLETYSERTGLTKVIYIYNKNAPIYNLDCIENPFVDNFGYLCSFYRPEDLDTNWYIVVGNIQDLNKPLFNLSSEEALQTLTEEEYTEAQEKSSALFVQWTMRFFEEKK